MPVTGGTSSGDGRNSTTASSSNCTPLFLSALPQSTGVVVGCAGLTGVSSVTRRSAAWISCTVSLCPSTKLIIVCSSTSPMASIILSCHSAASAAYFSGIGASIGASSRLPVNVHAFISMRSMTPSKSASAPIGICTGIGFAPRRSLIMSTVRQKFAPIRSILLTKQMRGTLYLSACRHTVSDCGSTPATASNTTTPPSSTRRLRSTSTVKST